MDVTLETLEAKFLKVVSENSFKEIDGIVGADGVMYLCPKCFVANGGRVGTHRVVCWRPHVPQSILPTPGRWDFLGTGINDLELKAGSSSVLLTSGCRAHFFVKGGAIQMT